MSDVSENEMPCENAYFSCQIFLRMKCPVKMYLSDVKAHIYENQMPCENVWMFQWRPMVQRSTIFYYNHSREPLSLSEPIDLVFENLNVISSLLGPELNGYTSSPPGSPISSPTHQMRSSPTHEICRKLGQPSSCQKPIQVCCYLLLPLLLLRPCCIFAKKLFYLFKPI